MKINKYECPTCRITKNKKLRRLDHVWQLINRGEVRCKNKETWIKKYESKKENQQKKVS